MHRQNQANRIRHGSRLLIMFCITFASTLLTACNVSTSPQDQPFASPPQSPDPTKAEQGASTSPLDGEPTSIPDLTGPEPSNRVAVFYYPWYGTPDDYGEWVHWDQAGYTPPSGIGSDYYPVLGAYSSLDPEVVAQHFAWLREVGVGVIISSWWGQGTREDRAVPLLLEQGERYGIKVALHIEPYDGRTARGLFEDIRYLYRVYGDHPAFFRSSDTSRWSPDTTPKGVFFVWAISIPDNHSAPVEASYWREALDDIHALSDGALVIANITDTSWIDRGHFDGLYNYADLSTTAEGSFDWAQGLPPDSFYVPSVIPGFSARRIGYANDTFVDRQGGLTYDNQWETALDTGIEPAIVTITSFNEWHEGSQIEPAEPQSDASVYADYDPLPPNAYLTATREWVEAFLNREWPEAATIRLHIKSASDWTTFGLIDGGTWMRPDLVSASEEADYAWMEGDHFALLQPLEAAERNRVVEMIVDLQLSEIEPDGNLTFEIERGHIGWTEVELYRQGAEAFELVQSLRWYGISGGDRNTRTFTVPTGILLGENLP